MQQKKTRTYSLAEHLQKLIDEGRLHWNDEPTCGPDSVCPRVTGLTVSDNDDGLQSIKYVYTDDEAVIGKYPDLNYLIVFDDDDITLEDYLQEYEDSKGLNGTMVGNMQCQ